MWQHWLGNTKYQIDPKYFQKVATEYLFNDTMKGIDFVVGM